MYLLSRVALKISSTKEETCEQPETSDGNTNYQPLTWLSSSSSSSSRLPSVLPRRRRRGEQRVRRPVGPVLRRRRRTAVLARPPGGGGGGAVPVDVEHVPLLHRHRPHRPAAEHSAAAAANALGRRRRGRVVGLRAGVE